MSKENRRRRRHQRGTIDPAVVATWTDKQRLHEKIHRALELPLAEAKLPVRVVNTMEANGVFLIKDLLEEDGDDLVNMKNLGEKTVREIIDCIRNLGLDPPESWSDAMKKKPAAKPPTQRKPDDHEPPRIPGHNFP